jgi:Asp-tRNA(Asn)/Glu-tRNA(Gln) amidotransferase A subunit family amidase
LLSSEELIEACFARIDELEDEIGAWTQLDKALAMEQARAADDIRFRGKPMGALHGLPVGIKDIIDTADYPTERGTVLHQGRRPERDATLVSLLKEAGAVILGKTVSTELAVYAPGKTRNPHNPEHTPGGSSSGSAAAVSAAMVPFAVGTQTNGSVIRPAAYCGVYGFKPSFARISRHGVMTQSPPLDTIGLFARSLDDLAMIADVLMRFDAQDEAMTPVAPPSIATVLAEEVPANPHFAFVRTPAWGQVEAITKDGFRELIEEVNERQEKTVDIFDLPPAFDELHEDHRKVMEADLARNFDYDALLQEILDEYDAIMTPATPGPAPAGLEATGSPVMNTIWTFCGTPALNVPLLQSPEGLPIGVQVVGARDDDARLFRTARWLLDILND